MIIQLRARRTWVVWCLSFALLCFSEKAWSASFRFVQWFDDGDTIVLSDGTSLRYIGVDAPEIKHKDMPAERFGRESKVFNRDLVYHKKVHLELGRQQHDHYGRLLAYVFLEDGTFVNDKLVRSGYAYYLFREPNTKHNRLLLIAQREAMAKRVGLWKEFQDKIGHYIGNKRSKRFHRTTCRFGKATAKRNRISFDKRYAAFWAGYSPCKKCKP